MKKRIISLVCCIALVAALLPVGALADTGRTETFGGHTYNVIQGYHHSPTNVGSDFDDAYIPFFYSDGYFDGDSTVLNQHLATMSLNLAIASSQSFSDPYIYCHGPARQLLADIGCDEEKFFVNEDALKAGENHTIGYMLSQKELTYIDGEETKQTGYTLIPVVPRSSGYGLEWVSNVTLGPEGEAKGFADSANEVFAGVKDYLEKYGLMEKARRDS